MLLIVFYQISKQLKTIKIFKILRFLLHFRKFIWLYWLKFNIYFYIRTVKNPETLFLAWTTTPWTLPSNLSLAVHPDLDYLKIEDNLTKKIYILAECRLGEVYKNPND